MESGLTASDIALMNRDSNDWGGNSFMWIFALLILAGGGFGGFNNRYADSAIGTYATASSQQEILFGQQFQNLGSMINKVGDGISSLGYSQLQQMDANTASINGNITSEGRALQTQLANCCCENQRNVDSVRFDMANYASAIQQNDTANTQKILDAISQNKIESLQGQINQLQLQNAMNGVVRYPNASTYYAGNNPFCNCNYGCGCSTL